MKVLLHTCCAPCTIYPLKILRQDAHDITSFYYRNNIHPYTECVQREETLREYASKENLNVICQKGYDMEEFLRGVVFREKDRCAICYHERLETTARYAKKGNFDSFSTTLLYSRFQKHDMIRSIGEAVGTSLGILFYYHDFREGWKEGIEESKRLQMYRQQYCGCIYSEKERYFQDEA